MRLIITKASQFKLKQNLLYIGTTTFVTVLFWIAYSVYVAFSTTDVDPEVQQLLDPLNPTLDEDTLAILEDRYLPPENYTILVRQEVGDSFAVVPLGTDPNAVPASPAAALQTDVNPSAQPEDPISPSTPSN